MPNPISNRAFMVGDKPYCVWYLEGTNDAFLRSIDTNYFRYLAETHTKNLDEENKQKAAIALRTAYYHGLETLFMLIFAAMQAPNFAIGWLLKCQPLQLREFVRDATLGELSLVSTMSPKEKVGKLSWGKISELINGTLSAGQDDSETMQKSFAKLWEKFATDFTKEIVVAEYNSFKHGFRIAAGGGPSLSFNPPPQSGGQPVTISIGFANTFYAAEQLTDAQANHLDHHFKLKCCHVKLQPVIMAKALCMISISIKNVVAFLQFLSGVSIEQIQFAWPDSKEAYDLFSYVPEGLEYEHLEMKVRIPEKRAGLTKQQIVERLTKLAQK